MDSQRRLVYQTLDLTNSGRVPRQLWVLPWANIYFPTELEAIRKKFPDDIAVVPGDELNLAEGFQVRPPATVGNPYEEGEYIDVWGCTFSNYQKGLLGEVKVPLVVGEDWEDENVIEFPYDALEVNKEAIDSFCRTSSKFVIAADLVRPFERLQFMRGSQRLYIDFLVRPRRMMETLRKVHNFYCELLSNWAKTEVDALWVMDDWGSQGSLLIDPRLWREIFEPLYRDYVKIAHNSGKRIFFHSDGNILQILPNIIEIGFDAINAQIFCMGLENLSQFKGQITFWGEIDRQYLLAAGTEEEVERAVKQVKSQLWSNGGCIGQCEFGVGAKPANVERVFETWERSC